MTTDTWLDSVTRDARRLARFTVTRWPAPIAGRQPQPPDTTRPIFDHVARLIRESE